MEVEENYTKDNYSIKLKKECEQNSISINCENKNNKKCYIVEYNSDKIITLFGKTLDETFHILCEWIKRNNNFIEERNDEIIIKINNVLIKLCPKQNNTNININNSENNINSLSSIPNNTELMNTVDISSSNSSINIFIPTNENLKKSVVNDFDAFINLSQSYYSGVKLTGLLKLCLSKKILSDLMEDANVQIILKQEFINILSELDKNIHLTDDSNQDLKIMIKEKKAFNILLYSNYLENSILSNDIIKLLYNLKTEKKTENEKYWNYLPLFLKHNEHFEKTFIEDLKNCYFDYSLVSINCVISDNIGEYQKRNYKKKKILYHYSKINPFSKKLNEELKISNEPQDENFFYDNFEYFAFSSLKKKESRKIILIDSTFSFIASEVFFPEESLSNISAHGNQSSLSKENIILNKSDIHSIIFEDENLKKKHKSLGNYYTIKEKSQILPLYTITLKRNEYFVLHRDPNFNEKNEHAQFLRNLQKKNSDIFDINIYYESSTEEALEFLIRRQYNKVILITNVGPNLEGKRFVDIVRKILGFDVLVLFFSHNKKHLDWIKDYNNSFFTDNTDYYREFITNFNENGLKALQKKLEKENSINFKNYIDSIDFPNRKEKGNFSSLNFHCKNFKKGYFKIGNNYLYMNLEGNVSIKPEKCKWTITILRSDITLLSNGFYLDVIEDTEKVKGNKHMVIWEFEKNDNNYKFFIKNKDKNIDRVLSIQKEEIKLTKIFDRKILGENETFIFEDALEDCLEDESYLSENIESAEDSLILNSNMTL